MNLSAICSGVSLGESFSASRVSGGFVLFSFSYPGDRIVPGIPMDTCMLYATYICQVL